MYNPEISDLRNNVRNLVSAAEFLGGVVTSSPEATTPAIIAVYNALLDVIHTLNAELAVERDGVETINLQKFRENGISANITLYSGRPQ